jgi:hypothetical protein
VTRPGLQMMDSGDAWEKAAGGGRCSVDLAGFISSPEPLMNDGLFSSLCAMSRGLNRAIVCLGALWTSDVRWKARAGEMPYPLQATRSGYSSPETPP